MSLFVDKTLAIEAPILKVWEVLTDPAFTVQWSKEFAGNGPAIHVESGWKLGDKVVWRNSGRKVVAEGKVTAVRAPELLCFNVSDVANNEKFGVGGHDGVTFELTTHGGSGKTILHLAHGNFARMAEGRKLYRESTDIWERVLPIIKELSENE